MKAILSLILVYIQPLGDVNLQHIKTIEASIKNVYGLDCTILPAVADDKSLSSASTSQYSAPKIMSRYYSKKDYVIVVTESDMVHWKSISQPNESIMGLARMGGPTSVVSTYKLNADQERLGKLAVHELGHNLGLLHCRSKRNCVMKDIEGSVEKLDNAAADLCNSCKHKLNHPPLKLNLK